MTVKTGRTRKSRCAVCVHKERHQLEMLRVAGLSLDALAAKFSVSRDSIHRHFLNHVTEADRAAYASTRRRRDGEPCRL